MKRFPILMAGVIALGGTAAEAAPSYSQIIVFGDSLTDSGNAQLGAPSIPIPDPAPASAGYYNGRFSNGYNFADYLSIDYLGTPATPYLAGGVNFSVGGADAATKPAQISPSFGAQYNIFDALSVPIASDALVVVAFGGNDLRDVVANPGPVDWQPTIDAMTDNLQKLIDDGATNIVVTGLPNIGLLPITQLYGPALSALATARSDYLNAEFRDLVLDLRDANGVNIQFFDLAALEKGLRADPAAYGLPGTLNLSTPCQLDPASAMLGCANSLYFDPIHPTTQVHAVIAAAIEQQLSVPEPASWALMIGGFALTGAAMRRRAVAGVRFA